MNTDTIKDLLAYNKWANEQVWSCVDEVSQETFKAEHDYSHGSLHNQTFHIMQSDWMTLQILQGKDLSEMPQIEDYPDFAAIKMRAIELDQQINAFFEALESYDDRITLPFDGSFAFSMKVSELLLTSINHGTNHRAQILALLHKHGARTCEQGYFFYVMAREKEAAA